MEYVGYGTVLIVNEDDVGKCAEHRLQEQLVLPYRFFGIHALDRERVEFGQLRDRIDVVIRISAIFVGEGDHTQQVFADHCRDGEKVGYLYMAVRHAGGFIAGLRAVREKRFAGVQDPAAKAFEISVRTRGHLHPAAFVVNGAAVPNHAGKF